MKQEVNYFPPTRACFYKATKCRQDNQRKCEDGNSVLLVNQSEFKTLISSVIRTGSNMPVWSKKIRRKLRLYMLVQFAEKIVKRTDWNRVNQPIFFLNTVNRLAKKKKINRISVYLSLSNATLGRLEMVF